jgi:hypothetical protein
VYVVKEDKTVAVRPVTLGVSHGEDASVTSGLAPDELVVVDGTEKLREGSKVEVRNRNEKSAQGEAPSAAASPYRGSARESVAPVHHATGGDRADHGCNSLGGAIAYRQLPVSALPQIDYPTIQVLDLLSRRQSRRDGVVRHGAARTAIRTDAGLNQMTSDEFQRQFMSRCSFRWT